MDLKELYIISKTALDEMSPLDNSDFRLEQAEFIAGENVWDVVVSYLVENTNKPTKPFAALTIEYPYHRMYKRLKIDQVSKAVVGLFIYNNKE